MYMDIGWSSKWLPTEAIFKYLFDAKPDCKNLEVCMPAPSHEKNG